MGRSDALRAPAPGAEPAPRPRAARARYRLQGTRAPRPASAHSCDQLLGKRLVGRRARWSGRLETGTPAGLGVRSSGCGTDRARPALPATAPPGRPAPRSPRAGPRRHRHSERQHACVRPVRRGGPGHQRRPPVGPPARPPDHGGGLRAPGHPGRHRLPGAQSLGHQSIHPRHHRPRRRAGRWAILVPERYRPGRQAMVEPAHGDPRRGTHAPEAHASGPIRDGHHPQARWSQGAQPTGRGARSRHQHSHWPCPGRRRRRCTRHGNCVPGILADWCSNPRARRGPGR